MHENLTTAVRRFVSENFMFCEDIGSLDDDASFLDAGIIDSTGVLELISHLEHTYGIEVSDDEMLPENFDSVNRIAAYLRRKLAARPSVTDQSMGADPTAPASSYAG